jgi:PBP1b-binding outer membrane lipoprotein LpoB
MVQQQKKVKMMKKIIALLLAGMFFLVGCTHRQNLSEKEKQTYRESNRRYNAGQRPR